jgi:hypothetical protein
MSKRMAITWQKLGSNMTSKTMARPEQDHGKTRASAWQDQSKCMARPQQVHGKHTARTKTKRVAR